MLVVLPFVLAYVALSALLIRTLLAASRRLCPSVRRTWLGLGAVVLAIVLTPLPVRHGGVTLLVPTMVREGLRELRQPRDTEEVAPRDPHIDSRFLGYLPDGSATGHWRDEASGLVWSGRVGGVPGLGPDTLTDAQTMCARLEPPGYWAVPRSAEFYLLARAGRVEGPWLADLFVMPGGISVAARVGRGPDHGDLGVRCVAVTPPAPRGGYVTADIPLEEWNRYQLGLPPGAS